MYTYIQSRFYRAPEVLLGCSYGKEIEYVSCAHCLWVLYRGFIDAIDLARSSIPLFDIPSL